MKNSKRILSLLFILSTASLSAQVMIKDINTGSQSSYISKIIPVNNNIFFRANDGLSGFELWKSDGTTTGTSLIKDMNPNGDGLNSLFNSPFAVLNNTIFFAGGDNMNGIELWKSDGTSVGTMMIKDIYPGSSTSIRTPGEMVQLNGNIYFSADDGNASDELWQTDGTSFGTTLVKDIASVGGSYIKYLTRSNNTLFFSADDFSHGAELWKTDGTSGGTVMVKNIETSGGSYPQFLIDVNGILYFAAYTSAHGKELWKSDGTDAGTMMVKDINPGSANSINYTNVNNFINVNGTLYFSADDGVNGIELWKTDGTDAGTVMIKDIRPGSAGGLDLSNYKTFMNINNTLYFTANDGVIGTELWKTDGTPAGTVLVKDLRPGSMGSDPKELINFNNVLYFNANNSVSRLWKSDGTAGGTNMINSQAPGSPTSLTVMGSNLYFYGSDLNHGGELWKYDGSNMSIEDMLSNKNVFSIYPNPSSGHFQVRITDEMSAKKTIEISNILGLKVYENTEPNIHVDIDFSGFPKGIYLVKVFDGQQSSIQKIVIQ